MTDKPTFDQLVAAAKRETPRPVDVRGRAMTIIRRLPRIRPATPLERLYDAITRAVADFFIGDQLSDVGASDASYAPMGASLDIFGLGGL